MHKKRLSLKPSHIRQAALLRQLGIFIRILSMYNCTTLMGCGVCVLGISRRVPFLELNVSIWCICYTPGQELIIILVLLYTIVCFIFNSTYMFIVACYFQVSYVYFLYDLCVPTYALLSEVVLCHPCPGHDLRALNHFGVMPPITFSHML